MKGKILFGIIAAMLMVVPAAIGERPDEVKSTPSDKVSYYEVLSKTSIPKLINYQGYLTDPNDNPITGMFEMTFSVWDAATGGTQLWSETQLSVAVTNGLFNALLGSVNPIPPGIFTGAPRWLQIQVGAEILSPRKEIVSVAYVFRAGVADSAGIASYAYDATHAYTSDYSAYADFAGVTGSVDYADSAGIASYAHDADMIDGQHASDFLSTADDWGRSGVATDLYEGTTKLTDKYVSKGQANSITRAMIVDGDVDSSKVAQNAITSWHIKDGTIQRTDLSFTPGAGDGHSLDAADGDPVDAVYVDNAGNVGIGTTSPAEKLEVSGAIKIGNTTNTNAGTIRYTGITFEGYDTLRSTWLYLVGDGDWTISGGDVYSAGSGNVGIGTSNPQEKLEVHGVVKGVVGAQEFYLVPKGAIIMWSGYSVPPGWALCNGAQGTPDLRDRFIVSTGSRYVIGDIG